MSASSALNEAIHVPLEAQVGGHKGVMTTEDGSLLIKPALPVEVSFYQSVGADPAFAPLRPFIPKFYGILKLEGVVDPEKGLEGGELKPVPAQDKDMFFPIASASTLSLNPDSAITSNRA